MFVQEKEFVILSIDEVSFDGLDELEEVVTPGWGCVACC